MQSKEQVLQLMRERAHHPATVPELMRLLRIDRRERASFKRLLGTLADAGDLVRVREHRFGLPEQMDLLAGRLQTHPSGFGFVAPDDAVAGVRADIYIAAPNMGDAMHGDRVLVRVERHKDDGRTEGRVVRVVERSASSIVGRFAVDRSGAGLVVPFDRRMLLDVHIPRGEVRDAKPGDMVAVEITTWPTATRGPAGRVTEVLGGIDDPGVDVKIMLRKHGIPDEHGADAIEEARRITASSQMSDDRAVVLRDVDRVGRTDFRSIVTVTIDGEHARDFDDAVSIERLANGHYWLGVHIADVSHYVEEGSALDVEAYERGTSVYFPDRAVHMFPSELATGLCSLNPRVDRLVQSCLMEIDPQGDVVRHEFHDGIIRTTERLTYTAVNAVLTDHDAATIERYRDLVPMFERMGELFQVLNQRRRRRGSVDFDLNEAEVVIDDAGRVEAITAAERNIAHRIIEEFMLVANETVAHYFEETGGPGLYRVHEPPTTLRVMEFEEFVSGLGYSLGAPPEAILPRHFQRLVERISGTPEEKPIAFLMLRTMQRARYDAACLGHFGLAATAYTHFTSPIRRYPDLIVHRLLREHRRGPMSRERREECEEDLPERALRTSMLERRADDAERELLQWKKVRFMADKVGDEFDGYITGVAAFGLFVELIEHFVEGRIHVSTMADDFYRFLDKTHTLRGENTHRTYRLGDKVRVQVVRVDEQDRHIDLALADILEAVRKAPSRRLPRTKARPKKAERRQRPGKRERRAGKKKR